MVMRRSGRLGALGSLVLLAVALAACSSPRPGPRPTPTTRPGTPTTAHSRGTEPATTTTTTTTSPPTAGTATFAEAPGQAPDFIAPITPVGANSVANTAQFSVLMWRPLVWPGTGQQLGPNPAKSLYASIAYNHADTAVTITLKDWSWSDGQPVTARDITFFLNLVRANEHAWSGWVPGQLPDNIKSATVTGARTLVLHLTTSVSPFWFTDNELSLITPIPQQAWDKASAKAKVGNLDQTVAGAREVWAFLVGQARDTATFATNPLWQVVDGPWRLAALTRAGEATFVPNAAYSGSDTPTLASFVEVPFANVINEVDALAAGKLDVGYLSAGLLGEAPILAKAGFKLSPWIGLGMAAVIPNLTNPAVGPILRQVYVRQALQQLVDQPDIVKTVYAGYASASYGPVPLAPADPYASPAETAHPYGFSPTNATTALIAHGWQSTPGGADVCGVPASCGPGIAKGQSLVLSLAYPSGNPRLADEVELIKSAALQAGVVIDLRAEPPSSFAATIKPCPTSCGWELATFEGYPYKVLPGGEALFVKGGPLDVGGYNSPTNAANVAATMRSAAPAAFYAYEDYLVNQLPWIWMPSPYYRLTEVSSALSGVTPQNVYRYLDPQDWRFSG